ncbi:hypothetical protein [Lactobacillus johnsonii]|uniref:Uncharacterized protein n=1 Tax=Lactobacillus johnsonii (strain CNCM I-12250 / La1 / NCC 533) TaxID=257314 RepID=Q74JR5_LACJO|nr:hypothetical protein [Lactobacillus johnsonii]AAS08864.1 hypothetical protein LJ_1042 [Lactobacillus johnsonii NCC 533]MCT3321164.1 hypothetical protein [Lactobacillus johnsonii]MCT3340737.1 hypothetical protein [Lactobacillus johnsonii]MCT3389416.1 hypothetical protein [Lactobacillus johnsonii]
MKKLKNLVNLENICLSCLLVYIIACSIHPKYFKYLGISIEIVSVLLILVISYIERTKKEIETYKSKIENYRILIASLFLWLVGFLIVLPHQYSVDLKNWIGISSILSIGTILFTYNPKIIEIILDGDYVIEEKDLVKYYKCDSNLLTVYAINRCNKDVKLFYKGICIEEDWKKLNSGEITENQVSFWNDTKEIDKVPQKKDYKTIGKNEESEFYRIDVKRLRTTYLNDLVRQKNWVIVFKDIGGNYWTKKFQI